MEEQEQKKNWLKEIIRKWLGVEKLEREFYSLRAKFNDFKAKVKEQQ